jgi:Lipase (class 2)
MNSVTIATALALGSCTGLPAGDITSPQYWGGYFLDKYADQRAAAMDLEPGPAPLEEPRTVLLITGVTIPAVWFDPIKARLERDGFRTVVYEPPELLSGDLFENAEALADVVDYIREQTGEEKIDILAECTGGLIARHYIQALGGDKTIARMVTFISPQRGVAKAPLAAEIAGWPALHDLSPGSEFLETVNSAPLPSSVAVTSIYSCTDEYIQPFETSIIPGARNIGLCDGFVGHFQFFTDPDIYLLMHAELTAPTAEDADDVSPPADDAADPPPFDSGDPQAVSPEPEEGAGGCSTGNQSVEGVGLLLVLGAWIASARRRRERGAGGRLAPTK